MSIIKFVSKLLISNVLSGHFRTGLSTVGLALATKVGALRVIIAIAASAYLATRSAWNNHLPRTGNVWDIRKMSLQYNATIQNLKIKQE